MIGGALCMAELEALLVGEQSTVARNCTIEFSLVCSLGLPGDRGGLLCYRVSRRVILDAEMLAFIAHQAARSEFPPWPPPNAKAQERHSKP